MTPNNCHQPEEKIVVAFDVKRIQIGLIQIELRVYGTNVLPSAALIWVYALNFAPFLVFYTDKELSFNLQNNNNIKRRMRSWRFCLGIAEMGGTRAHLRVGQTKPPPIPPKAEANNWSICKTLTDHDILR